MARFLKWLLLVLFGVAVQNTLAAEPPQEKYPLVREIPAISADGLEIPKQTLTLSENNGWLVVTLVEAPDRLAWKVVLAKITPDVEPEIKIHPQLPLFSVQYGAYFVRESLGRLRVYRERKDPRNDSWAVIGEAPEGESPCTAGRLFVVVKDDWCWVCTSPKYDNKSIDALIRFQHVKLKKGHGSTLFADGEFGEVFCGEARCHDEGDLLAAARFPEYAAKAYLAAEETHNTLIGGMAPEVTGKTFGAEAPSVDLAALRGKVVLVDFWATWCGPCVKKLPEVSQLQEKYRDEEFTVVGVHSAQGSEGLDAFLQERPLPFPVVLDDGETQKRYAVSEFPTYFLVGRDGKVVSGFKNTPPTAAQIEAALKASGKQD